MDRLQGVPVSPGTIYKCGCVPRHRFWRNDPECPLYFQRDLWPRMLKSRCSTPCPLATEQGSSAKRSTASAAELLYAKSSSLPSLLKVKVESLSRTRLLRPVDCSPPSSSVHGILQARILEWVAINSPLKHTPLALAQILTLTELTKSNQHQEDG